MNNIIERIWKQGGLVNIEDLRGTAFQAEESAHTFRIRGMDESGEPLALTGTCAAIFLRADNTDVAITGTITDGAAEITLTDECYDMPGRFGLTIYVTSDEQTVAVYAAIGSVCRTSSGVVSPETGEDVMDLINAIAEAVATIPASYTDLMAAVAPTYSTSALYAVGSYAWYDGKLYRCTTAITSGETWTSAHWTQANLGSDVSDLKSAFNNATERGLNSFSFAPDISVGKGINVLNGKSVTQAKYSRTNILESTGKNAVGFTSDTYELQLVFYNSSGSTSTGAGMLGYDGMSDGMHFLSKDAEKYVVNFRRKDGTNMSDADATAIQTILKYFTITDETFTLSNVPADAKVTGERFEANENQFKMLSLYPSDVTLSSDLVNETVTGKYVQDNGNYANNANFNVKKAPVEGGKVYAVECFAAVGNANLLCFKSQSGGVVRDLSSLPYNYFSKFADGNTYLVKAPAFAEKLELSVKTTNPDVTIKEVLNGQRFFEPDMLLTKGNFTQELVDEISQRYINYYNLVRKPFDFAGKNIAFIGDSITYGMTRNTPTDDIHRTNSRYSLQFCRAFTPNATEHNHAVSGATYAEVEGYSSLKDQIETVDTTDDFLFISAGTNDWGLQVSLSDFEDAVEYVCDYINTNFPTTTKVIFITPINQVRTDGGDGNVPVAPLDDYRRIITRTVSEKDTYNRFSIVQGKYFNFPTYNDDEDYILAMLPDKLHPSELGYKALYVPGLLNALL